MVCWRWRGKRAGACWEAVDPDTGSGSIRLIGMGSVSGLKSFLALEREEEILREKSSGSASGVGRGTTTYCCLRGEEGDRRGGTGLGLDSISQLATSSLVCHLDGSNWIHKVWLRSKGAVSGSSAYPAVLRSAVSFSSRSIGCRSFWGFLEGICLCSESTCIVDGKGDGAVIVILSFIPGPLFRSPVGGFSFLYICQYILSSSKGKEIGHETTFRVVGCG